jgi:hypothetical protein
MKGKNGIKVEMVARSSLKLFPGNPRVMPDRMMESLQESLKEFGMVDPIIALPDGRVIGGNQRLLAAEKVGLETVPVVRVSLSEAKAKKLNLALNKIAGEWNEDALAVWLRELSEAEEDLFSAGFEESDVDSLLDSETEEKEPEPELTIAPELFERHDYLVVLFENEFDWQVACEKFGLKTVLSAPVGGRKMEKRGTGRVLRAEELLEKLR